MQTKKRAKPVKFGKQPKKEEEVKTVEHEEKKVTEELDEQEIKEEKAKEEAEADINSAETEEIKKIIEEKTQIKEEVEEKAEESDDEPQEVNLSQEIEESHGSSQENEEKVEVEEIQAQEEITNKKVSPELEVETVKEEEKPSSFGSFTREEVLTPKKKNPFGFFLLVALIAFTVGLALIAGGSYFLSTLDPADVKLPSIQEPSPTPTTQPSVTPTPEEVDLSAYSIQILNGSGITGEAAKLQAQLEEAGFTVDNVGNAGTSDYTKTVVAAKDDVDEAFLNKLVQELKTMYNVNSVTESLPDSKTTDVVVTIGSDTAN